MKLFVNQLPHNLHVLLKTSVERSQLTISKKDNTKRGKTKKYVIIGQIL